MKNMEIVIIKYYGFNVFFIKLFCVFSSVSDVNGFYIAVQKAIQSMNNPDKGIIIIVVCFFIAEFTFFMIFSFKLTVKRICLIFKSEN